ncbi:MAG: S41 family peptidase [Pseudomonadota bacterium]
MYLIISKKIFFVVFLTIIFNVDALERPEMILWKEDLSFYHEQLESQHLNLYHSIKAKSFAQSLRNIENQLPDLTRTQVIIELMRLTRKVKDGHTTIPLWEQNFHFYPFELFNFDGELRVISSTPALKNILGAKLIAIDDKDIDSVLQKVSEIAAFVDNHYSEIDRAAQYLRVAELLHGLGVTQNNRVSTFTFSVESGSTNQKNTMNTLTIEIQALAYSQRWSALTESLKDHSPVNRPPQSLFLSHTETLWYNLLKSKNVMYIRFDQFPNASRMQKFSQEVLQVIQDNEVSRLIIDFRNNYGGDLYVGLILAHQLNLADSIHWHDSVYVMIGRKTFSAAMNNAALYQKLLNARLVGEPTGGAPTGYQDMGQFKLPNSGLVITYSKRFFRLSDDKSSMIKPDILIAPDWRFTKMGRDHVLEWVLEDKGQK